MPAVVNSPVCPLYLRPDGGSELADEALLGWVVELLAQPAPGWYRVMTDYGYTGYAPAECLVTDPAAVARWVALPKRTVLRGVCTLRARPDIRSPQVSLLLRGAALAVLGEPDREGWQPAALPDGRAGWVKAGFLFDIPTLGEEGAFREHAVRMARLYLGAHYLWGGKTPLGIDCSGLAFMAYRLSGAAIWRDAALRPPLRAISLDEAKPGDLLFFPGHVAMYLGEGRYIHATARDGDDGVVINSLDPTAPDYRSDLPEKLTAVGSLF